MQKDFDLLLNTQSLGFYNCCELTNIFIVDITNNQVYNFFTILTFEERLNNTPYDKFLTPNLIKLSSNLKLGIYSKLISTTEAKNIFTAIYETGTLDIGKGQLIIGKTEKIRKIFVPKNSTIEPTLNNVLKNNFFNGSYVLEFFDIEKPLKTILDNNNLFVNASELIVNYIPLKLLAVPDRVGNILFQFPSLNIDLNHSTNDTETELHYKIKTDERLADISNVLLMSNIYSDDTTLGFNLTQQLSSDNIVLDVGNADYISETKLIDTDNNLLLHQSNTSFIRNIRLQLSFQSPSQSTRTVKNTDNTTTEIAITSSTVSQIGHEDKRYKHFIEERKYKDSIANILSQQEFKVFRDSQHLDAVKYMISLMEKSSNIENIKYVGVWDPYLQADDLLETWYKTNTNNIFLKAITSKEVIKIFNNSVDELRENQIKTFENRSNNYKIKLELRCQHNTYGYKFHDRFLLIVPQKGFPIVWSLGTSLNSIGKSHHIIQKVLHPQMVVDAFEELWEELNHEDCIIWKRGI